MSAEATSTSLNERAKHLFSILDSPFERTFDPLSYQAQLELPVHPDTTFYDDDSPRGAAFGQLIGRSLAPYRNWLTEVGYVPQAGSLGFTRLDLPLKTPQNDDYLVLRRTPLSSEFMPFYRRAHSEKNYHQGAGFSIPAQFVTRLLADAGYLMPQLFTSPSDLKLHMAELTDRSVAWTTTESVSIPDDTDSVTTITRVMSRRHGRKRVESETTVEAVSEFINPRSGQRNQLVVTFQASDHLVGLPTIERRRLDPINTVILTDASTTDYATTARSTEKVTNKLLDRLMVSYVDTLADAA